MTLSTKFAEGIRQQLIDTAAGSSPIARSIHRRRIALGGVAALASAALLTAGTLVVVNGIPGEHVVTGLGNAVSGSFTGPATVELGERPATANAISFTVTCTSPGKFSIVYDDVDGLTGTEWECGDGDGLVAVGRDLKVAEQPLPLGATSFDVTADAGTTWDVTAQYATSVTTDWGINANGQSYGAYNENGSPDLVPAQATNGEVGYIYSEQLLNDRIKENHTLPVYKADGVTQIGEFPIGNS